MMFGKALLIKIRNFTVTLLMVHVPVVAHANNWNNGSSSSVVSFSNIRLDCETTNYGLSGYPDKWGKSWVPPRYSLVASGGTVTLSGSNAKGRVTRDTAERIEVVFDSAQDTRTDGGHLKGIYFRTNNKFMARVKFSGGYTESGPIWGVCNETSISSSNNVSPSIVPSTTTPSTSKLEKAKSTCTELGFTAGTEKHGDCVLKMMDN
jgi:hypothetical protein